MFNLQHGSRASTSARKQHNTTREEIDKSTKTWRITRFCDVCKNCNVDPLSNVSVILIFIVLSKIKKKKSMLTDFGSLTGCECDCDNVDLNERSSDMFHEVNDWVTLFDYVEVNILEEEIQNNLLVSKFSDALVKANLNTEYNCTVPFIVHTLLHVMIQEVSSAKTMEQTLSALKHKQNESVCKDLELRCLRAVGYFADDALDEKLVYGALLPILQSLVIKPQFKRDVTEVLRIQETMLTNSTATQERELGRLQLRRIVKTMQRGPDMTYASTFEAWSAQQKFSVTTTRRLQLFLYFIKTQPKMAKLENIKSIFSVNILRKLATQSVDVIDQKAISSVIQSIRISSHNVAHLVDFRSVCLHGINSKYKNNLNHAQILQLYVSCYQHHSIREQCWRSIVPIWNFTIESACNKFREEYEYDIDAVIECICRCMLDDWRSQANVIDEEDEHKIEK